MTHLELSCSTLRFVAASGEETGEHSSHSGPTTQAHQSPSVLIVEDEGLVALNIEGALAEAGFRVVGVVDTAADAIETAERLKPDVILMDITLREGDGLSAAKVIQSKLRVQIIFVSGNSDPTTLAAAREARPAGFIRKPFLTERLAGLVRDAIAPKS